ncbi:MAG: hypothetical protein KDB26_16245 [Microthrixaceae bacterium]|nr:hypothetical protein [Microthrixaceae bacterium]
MREEITVIVIEQVGTELHVAFRYDPAVIEKMRTVPSAHWNPSIRQWVVSAQFATPLRVALQQWEVAWAGTAPSAPSNGAVSWAEALFTAVGSDRREAVFRALSKVLHPDTATGDTVLMQTLLEARNVA